ncbi:MAG: hypothetical protein Q4C98_06260 [Capnocytophaga sp.]|nr:hypothetical protein [Capnocytophaga sp.]
MKKLIFGFLFFAITTVFAQDKRTYSLAEIDIIIPRSDKVTYSYEGGKVNLSERVMWGATYSYNYNLFKKFSVGALGGLTYLSNPSLTSLKVGGTFRYTFISEYQANVFLQVAGYIPFNSKYGADLGEFRFGVQMPIVRFDTCSMTLGVFVTYSGFDVKKPLFYDENPNSLEYRGTGLSLGLRF